MNWVKINHAAEIPLYGEVVVKIKSPSGDSFFGLGVFRTDLKLSVLCFAFDILQYRFSPEQNYTYRGWKITHWAKLEN